MPNLLSLERLRPTKLENHLWMTIGITCSLEFVCLLPVRRVNYDSEKVSKSEGVRFQSVV